MATETIIGQLTLEAKKRTMAIVALTGKTSGKLGGITEVEINIPRKSFSDRIQETHNFIHFIEQKVVI